MAQAYHQESGVPTVSLRLGDHLWTWPRPWFHCGYDEALKAAARGECFEIPYRGKENYHFSHDANDLPVP